MSELGSVVNLKSFFLETVGRGRLIFIVLGK